MANSRHAAQLQLVEVDELTPTSAGAVPDSSRPTTAGAPEPRPPADAPLDDAPPGSGVAAGEDGWDPDDEAAPHGWPARRRRVLAWVAAIGAAVLVLAALAAWDDARRADAYERAVSVPGLLEPLDGPVHVTWRAAAASGEGSVVVADDTLVVVEQDSSGGSLVGYAAETGQHRWTTRVTGPPAATERAWLQCPSWRGARVSGLVLCTTDLAIPVYGDPAPGESVADGLEGLRVVAVDAATGRSVGSWTEKGDVAGFGRVDDDIVVAVTDPDGRTLVQRRAGRTGDIVWSYRSLQQLSGTLAIERASMELTDRVAVVRGAELVVLRLDDGEVVVAEARGQAVALVPFRDGFAAWTPARGGWMFDRDGEPVTALPAVPSSLAIDDESAQEVAILSTGVAVRGFEVATGNELWSLSTRATPQAVVDDTLLVADDGRWAAYDAHTGASLWSHELEAPAWPVLTDGSLVLTAVDDGDRVTLLARGLRDGAQRWQVSVPPQVTRLSAIGGLLVGRTDEGVVVLAP